MSPLNKEFPQPYRWSGQADGREEYSPEPPLTPEELQAMEDQFNERKSRLAELIQQLRAGLIDQRTYRQKFNQLGLPICVELELVIEANKQAAEDQKKLNR